MSNFTSIKAIIFDCDGTLVDSEGAHLSAWEQVLISHGKALSLEERLHFTGKPDTLLAEMLEKQIPSQTAKELYNQKRKYFSEYLHQGLSPIQGTVNFVHQLIEEKDRFGFKLAVASAAIKEEVLLNLKNLGLENSFDLVLSGHDDLDEYEDKEGVNKPKPYIYLHAAKIMGFSPSECVVIEDSHTGVTAGVSAGCVTIAIPNAHSKFQDLSKATLILETLENLSVENFLDLMP